MSDNVLKRSVELPEGDALLWQVDDGQQGVVRLERHEDCLALTWSSEWDAKRLKKFIKHTSSDSGGRSRSVPNTDAHVPLPEKIDALVVDRAQQKHVVSSCSELLHALAVRDAVFVRIDIGGDALVWTEDVRLDGWHGNALGMITGLTPSVYFFDVFATSAMPALVPLRAEVAAELHPASDA